MVCGALLVASCSSSDSTAANATASDTETVEDVDENSGDENTAARTVGDASEQTSSTQDDDVADPSDGEAPESSDGENTEPSAGADPEPSAGADPEPSDGEPVEAPPVNEEVEVDESVEPAVSTIAIPDIGDSAWAVVVAGASDPFDPLLATTVDQLAAAGYTTTITNCDVGAAVALGMQPDTSFTVSVYAADESAAGLLVDDLEQSALPGVVTRITVECP